MISVPAGVLEKLAQAYGVAESDLQHFSGGREESDGVLYVYPFQERQRLLKVMALPEEQELKGLFIDSCDRSNNLFMME